MSAGSEFNLEAGQVWIGMGLDHVRHILDRNTVHEGKTLIHYVSDLGEYWTPELTFRLWILNAKANLASY
jgi:hypothetical protein